MTTTIKTYDARELALLVGDDDSINKMNRWLERGDGVAVYENQAFDSSGFGDTKFVSFGSTDAQFEGDPPVQLPDFPQEINWRFRLVGTYSGPALQHLPAMDWITPFTFCDRTVRNFIDPTMFFADRVSSWNMDVRRVVTGSGEPTQAQRVDVCIKILDPFIEIHVQTWLYPEGINALAPFDWSILDDDHGTRTGTDPNLGSTNMAIYNNCLPPKEG